jgi:hypothetical protein
MIFDPFMDMLGWFMALDPTWITCISGNFFGKDDPDKPICLVLFSGFFKIGDPKIPSSSKIWFFPGKEKSETGAPKWWDTIGVRVWTHNMVRHCQDVEHSRAIHCLEVDHLSPLDLAIAQTEVAMNTASLAFLGEETTHFEPLNYLSFWWGGPNLGNLERQHGRIVH